jgi:hypothetical protein
MQARFDPKPNSDERKRIMFKIITTAVVGMAFALSAHAQDWFQFEAGIGAAAYQRGPDGLWVQDGFEHKLHLTAPAIEVGLTGDLYQATHWGLSWHADWAWLGTIKSQSLATPSDANYNVTTKGCNGPCWPLANYNGTGHDQGFMLTLEPHYDYAGWRFGVEAGPYIHRSSWAEDVTGWVSSPTATPTNLHVRNRAQWRVGEVFGASVGYRNLTIAYQFFRNSTPVSSSDPYPPIWRSTHLLVMKYRY